MQLADLIKPSFARSAVEDAIQAIPSPRQVAAAVVRRLSPRPDALETDDWGRDEGSTQLARIAAQLRWAWSIDGADRLPKNKGALVVVNRRRLTSHPVLAALALSTTTDRPVRFTGRSDIAPGAWIAQRIGGLLEQPAEIAGALRANEIVVIGAEPTIDPWKVGTVDHLLLEPAVRQGVPIHGAAVLTAPLRRSARIAVTRPIPVNRDHRGPLAEIDAGLAVQRRLTGLLTEIGQKTGTPLDWFGPSGFDG